MATYQVPGYLPANNDRLHEGCWAETDQQKLRVDGFKDGNVLFVIFHPDNLATRNEAPILEFQKAYSDSGWLWHDKTPFPG